MRDISKKAGVSVTTVSHVINETRIVSDELRLRVLSAMEELRYRPNALARSLRRGETTTIGLIVPNNANPFFSEIARGIEDTTYKEGYSLILCNSDDDVSRELRYTRTLIDKQVDGIIFVAAGGSEDSLQLLDDRNVPFVIVDRNISSVSADSVLIDNRSGGEQATDHLLQLNHRRIGCITGPSNLNSSIDRVVGYIDTLKRAELKIDNNLIVKGNFDFDSGYRCANELFALKKPPTAIFACNDMMAIGAIRAAEDADIEVPSQLSVVGFDGIPLAKYVTPPLTTVQQPKHELGQIASELLLSRIQNKELPIRQRILDTILMIRESTTIALDSPNDTRSA